MPRSLAEYASTPRGPGGRRTAPLPHARASDCVRAWARLAVADQQHAAGERERGLDGEHDRCGAEDPPTFERPVTAARHARGSRGRD